jgi:DNA-directed RNA polymerase subunit RPC12/RpoP
MNADEFWYKVGELPAIQLPRDCEFDGKMMVRSDQGIRCSQCGHQLFDIPRESERSTNPELCHCLNCFHKHQAAIRKAM